MRVWVLAVAPLLGILAGCPVPQSQDTPVPQKYIDAQGGRHGGYYLYVPSNYTPDHAWPLVITLHGTYGWDSAWAQIREWKALAQEKGFIVVAPNLRSVQGILPVEKKQWNKDLATDDATILNVLDELSAKYRVDPKAVLLTGFSAGGFPLYNTGLRHPDRFDMLVAMSCNSDVELFDKITQSPEFRDNPNVRNIPVVVFWGMDDQVIQDFCWNAVEYFSTHGFKNFQHRKIRGGHLRRPDVVYNYWKAVLPHSPQGHPG
jgi:poly(3-hydroxybutyrate) depolymerase